VTGKEQALRRPAVRVRWGHLVIAMVLLLLLGLIYAWSIFVVPLEEEFGWQRDQTTLAFSICMSTFCLGGLVAGFISKRMPPRVSIILCAVFVFIGFMTASRLNSLINLYVSYGGFVGFGVGLAYNAIISTVLKWFPDKQGFASGLLLMGFGFGGMVLGTASTMLIETMGWRNTFAILAVLFGVVILAASFVLRTPPSDAQFPVVQAKKVSDGTGLELTTGEMLRRPTFYCFFLWAVVLTAAGLVLIGHATPLATSCGADFATAAAMAGTISVCNGAGRVAVGFIFDIVGRKAVMAIVSGGFIVSSLILLLAINNGSIVLLTVGFLCTGFCYGGVMPTNSTVISKFYGMKNYSMNFSIINLNIIIASFGGPYLASTMQMASGTYATTAILILVFGVVALFLGFLIRKP